jgi:hypothetical protein
MECPLANISAELLSDLFLGAVFERVSANTTYLAIFANSARGYFLITASVYRDSFQFCQFDAFQAAHVDGGGIDALFVLGEGEG